jgi:hypothetical protein
MNAIIQNNSNLYGILRWVAVAFSILFIFVVSNGYYNLFVTNGVFIASLVGLLMSLLAWGFAKFIGSSHGGIKDNKPMFIALLLVSAVGVFNSLMINLEGKRIFQEAIDDASYKYNDLSIKAKELLSDPVLEEKKARVMKLKDLFLSELINPQNCGQGPVARDIATKIEQELPGFQMLAPGKNACNKIQELIKTYEKTIDNFLINSLEFVKGDYKEKEELKNRILSSDDEAQNELSKLKSSVNNGGNLLIDARGELENLSTQYQELSHELLKYSKKQDIPKSIDIDSVRNLGEWSQITNIILSRLDKPATYVYISLAVFFDWMLVYIFGRLSELKNNMPKPKANKYYSGIEMP